MSIVSTTSTITMTVNGKSVTGKVEGRTLLVLHVFVKKTQTTPRSAIKTALKRLEEST